MTHKHSSLQPVILLAPACPRKVPTTHGGTLLHKDQMRSFAAASAEQNKAPSTLCVGGCV